MWIIYTIFMIQCLKISKRLKPLSPTFWTAIIARPWRSKSIGIDAALDKIRELQNKANQEFQKRVNDYKIQMGLWEQKPKKDRGIRPEKPIIREKFYATNATLEGINRKMNHLNCRSSEGFKLFRQHTDTK